MPMLSNCTAVAGFTKQQALHSSRGSLLHSSNSLCTVASSSSSSSLRSISSSSSGSICKAAAALAQHQQTWHSIKSLCTASINSLCTANSNLCKTSAAFAQHSTSLLHSISKQCQASAAAILQQQPVQSSSSP